MKQEMQWKLMDKVKRKIFLKYELKKLLLKNLIVNKNLPLTARIFFNLKKGKITNFSMLTKINNRCLKTGRNFNVFKKVNYSRFVLRTEANKGVIPGFNRASW